MKHSPAEILFGRCLRDDLPRSEESLKPCVVNVMPKIQKAQRRQKQYCDRTTKEKPDFGQGEQVMVQRGSHWEPAVVIEKLPEPRSYRLDNVLRRTSFHLRPCPAKTEDNSVRNDKNTETDNEHERLDTAEKTGNFKRQKSNLHTDGLQETGRSQTDMEYGHIYYLTKGI